MEFEKMMIGRYPIYLNTVNILERIDELDDKIVKIQETVEENNTLIKYIQAIVEQNNPQTSSDVPEGMSIKEQILEKIALGLKFNQIVEDLKQMLIIEGIYDSEYTLLKVYTDNRTEDIMLAVKLKPNHHMGEIISFFYQEFGEPYRFITSDYKMRVILKYKLMGTMQMDEFDDVSGIVEQVRDDWGDRDVIRHS